MLRFSSAPPTFSDQGTSGEESWWRSRSSRRQNVNQGVTWRPHFQQRPERIGKKRTTANGMRKICTLPRSRSLPVNHVGAVGYRKTGIEQGRSDGTFPAVVWLVPHEQRKNQLQRALETESKLQRELFTVITPSELISLVRDGPPVVQ